MTELINSAATWLPHSELLERQSHSITTDIQSRFNLWYAGILTFLVGTLFQAFGANLQRWSAENEEEIHPDPRRCLFCSRPKAAVGLFLFASGGVVCSISLIFASETLMAPLVLLLFVFNPIFAYYMNKEPFDWCSDGFGTVLVMLGVGLVEGFSPHTSASYSVEYIEFLFRQSTSIGFYSVVGGGTLIVYLLQRRLAQRVTLGTDGYPIATEGSSSVEGGFLTVSYGAIAGSVGGLNVTLTKAVFSILVDIGDSGAKIVFTSWATWIVGIIVVVTYVIELRLTANGLYQVGSMIFLPCFAVVEQAVIAMGSLLFFQNYTQFTTLAATMFAIGNSIALIAVVVMASMRLHNHGERRALLSGKGLKSVDMMGEKNPGSGWCCGC